MSQRLVKCYGEECVAAGIKHELLGISRPSTYQLAHRADFPVVHLGGRMLVPLEQLKQWLEDQRQQANDASNG